MTDYEKKILCEVRGDHMPGLRWGAAMGAALEFLRGSGYVRKVGYRYVITPKGREALAS